MRKALYTFIFGGYDRLKEPQVITPGWDYICFTDGPTLPMRSKVWSIRRPALPEHSDKKKWAIAHMILHDIVLPDHDLTISIGGQIQVNCNLDEFVAQRFREDTPLMLIRHPERACVYDEAEACKALGKEDPSVINTYMRRHRERGMPPSTGLFATGVIGRRRGARLKNMCETWHREMQTYSRRDQLSLPYALWQHPLPISELGWAQTFGGDQPFILNRHNR